MGWLIAAGVLILLAVLPLGVSAVYDEAGPVVRLIAGPVRICVYPSKPKKEKESEKSKKETEKKEKPAKEIPPINREYFRPPLDLLETYTLPVNAEQENQLRNM